MKKAIVMGGGGFIGSHLVKRLKTLGYWVRAVDLKYPEFSETAADDFVQGDLRDPKVMEAVLSEDIDEVYQLAAEMGGAGYIFTGDNDADVMHNSAVVNLNTLHEMVKKGVKKVFYSSSACIYPERNQLDPDNPMCTEDSAYPAAPDSEYGWEKLFSERLYGAFSRNYGIIARVARFHNIYGPRGTWTGGREKAPAAICRKVAEANDGGVVEVWGDGKQTRSFLFIEDCVDGILALMNSEHDEPVNIGSEEMISINDFTHMIAGISGKNISIQNIEGPEGVRGRNSDNTIITAKTAWTPNHNLNQGITKTYEWINEQVAKQAAVKES